jgi:hypothetical protein
MNVHILVTYREGNEQFAELVFKTIRVGFPTANILVHVNGDKPFNVPSPGMPWQVHRVPDGTIHHEWIERLIREEQEPFWICDTDVVFYGPVEQWEFHTALAGYLVPEFADEFTKAVTRSRLHTSLMRIDPVLFKDAKTSWRTQHPVTEFNPPINLVHPVMVPQDCRTYFYDTMALAYHAMHGTAFTPQQKDTYFHFHFGTLGDVVLPHLANGEVMKKMRATILANPDLGRGEWRTQDHYFEFRQVCIDGVPVIAPIDPEDATEARKWNVELCRGDESAMTFCDLWYNYCHGIDDLIDTLRDGRPRMSKDQMISLFFKAALLYNSDFYIQHRQLLAPIVLQVTNTYRDSVAWENSPRSHLRQMADVFRTCGNEMFIMVALLTGGEHHMRMMSMAIKERDWLGQHDQAGRPL